MTSINAFRTYEPPARQLWLVLLLLTVAVGGSSRSHGGDERRQDDGKPVAFEWFQYVGKDEIFREPLDDSEYQNPIVAGFFPDPSIARKGEDYYMVHSSFAYAPGVPVLHSRNLVDWRLIGHVLTRPGQLDLRNQQVSRGIFAPTIRYHDGLFFVITTAVDAGGNFFVTAEDPAGPWSDPHWLPRIDGIDPDIFFDDDGKVWITHNGPPPGKPLYDGHRAIWLWEYDMEAGQVVASSGRVIVNGGVDLATEPVWIEAPHLYKIDGWYYLLCAEGGTGYEHSEVVFRTRSLQEPFAPFDGNPILTQRDLDIDRPHPVTTAGHADIVETPEGRWWAVFLATRTYDRTFYNAGRETFLLPVRWRNGWPVILERGLEIPYRPRRPATGSRVPSAEPFTGNFAWRDAFDDEVLSLHWNLLRGFDRGWFELTDGLLWMQPKALGMATLGQPAYLGRRQQHMRYEASTQLRLPGDRRVSAGIVAFQNETHHYFLGVQRSGGGYEVFLERAFGGAPEVIQQTRVDASAGEPLILQILGHDADISFYYSQPGQPAQSGTDWIPVAEGLDGKLLSTAVAGGFVGTTLGPHSRLEATSSP